MLIKLVCVVVETNSTLNYRSSNYPADADGDVDVSTGSFTDGSRMTKCAVNPATPSSSTPLHGNG